MAKRFLTAAILFYALALIVTLGTICGYVSFISELRGGEYKDTGISAGLDGAGVGMGIVVASLVLSGTFFFINILPLNQIPD